MGVKRFVSAKAVHDVREAYDKFEHVMYDGRTTVYTTEPTTERRGIGGESGPYFNISKFDELNDDEQASACCIPLSQPLFFWVVLYIWSLVCVCELRKTSDLFRSLVLQTEACETMADALLEDNEDDKHFVVAKLTKQVKAALTLLVLLPRLGITCYLLWLGCRWLLATNNFTDLILNSVALEFVLHLKDVLHLSMVPRRSVLDLADTKIKPTTKNELESAKAFIGTLAWGLLAAVWVTCYMGFNFFGYHVNGLQQVLREYNWDVHNVCRQWVLKRYAV